MEFETPRLLLPLSTLKSLLRLETIGIFKMSEYLNSLVMKYSGTLIHLDIEIHCQCQFGFWSHIKKPEEIEPASPSPRGLNFIL